MRVKSFILGAAVICCAIIVQSCGSTKQASKYAINLSAVDSPKNTNIQEGKIKVVVSNESKVQKYRYEDDYINITWFVDDTEFNFTLTNKTDRSMKINWDEISFVDINGIVGRMMHSGVKYDEINDCHPAFTIPKGATIKDFLIPANNVYKKESTVNLMSGSITTWDWALKPLIPNSNSVEGKTMKILIPIMIENVQHDFTFVFAINAKPETPQN